MLLNRVIIFCSLLDRPIWENVEWPRFLAHPVLRVFFYFTLILERVDGICGSGQSGTVKIGCVENAGVDISARYGKGGHCGNGQCGTILQEH